MRRAAIILALAIVLAGCARAPDAPSAAAPNPSPLWDKAHDYCMSHSCTTPSPVTPPPAPSLGTEVVTMYENAPAGKVTAFAFKQPVAQNAPRPEQAGYEWAAIDVRVCPLIDRVYVNTLPWALVYADSTNARPSSIGYQQFPKPEYPWGDQVVPNGQCVRGWITFDVPTDKRPTMIQYTPSGDGYTDWKL